MEQRKWSSVNNVGLYPGVPGPRRFGGKKSKGETLANNEETIIGNEAEDGLENGELNGSNENQEDENALAQVI